MTQALKCITFVSSPYSLLVLVRGSIIHECTRHMARNISGFLYPFLSGIFISIFLYCRTTQQDKWFAFNNPKTKISEVWTIAGLCYRCHSLSHTILNSLLHLLPLHIHTDREPHLFFYTSYF